MRPIATRWLSALLLPAAAWLAAAAVQMPRQGYTGLAVLGDQVASVDAGSPAERAGLRPRDRIAEFAPSPGPPVVGLDPRTDLRPGVPVVLTRIRGDESRRVWLAPSAMPAEERRLHTGLLVVATGFLLLGSAVWGERRDVLTRAFWLLCVAFSVLLAGPLGAPHPAWRVVLDLIYTAMQLLLPALFIRFFSLFPEAPRRARVPFHLRVATGVVLGLLGGWAATEVLPAELRDRLLGPLQVLSALWLATGVLAGLALFLAAFARHPNPDARRRLRVALVGTVLGAAPFALVVVSRSLSPETSLPGERWAVFATLLVPASFAWAIAVHRVFEFRVALRAVAGLLAALLAALALVGLAGALQRFGLPAASHGVLGAAVAITLYLAARLSPLRASLAALGARVVPIADERPLAAWTPSPGPAGPGAVSAILDSACETVMQALRLDGCSAVHFTERVAVIAHAGAQHRPQLSSAFATSSLARTGPRRPDELPHAGDDRDALEFAGVHWTLAVPGGSAALLLGRRLAGAWLDEHEASELARFAEHLGVAIENAELRREVHSRGALDRELEVAHDIQVRRLPRRAPVFATLDCAAASLSSEAVGGDFYDFLQDGPRTFTMAVGDAAGHGVPAALVQSGVQARFRDAALRARTPADVLAALNRELVALDQPEKFMGLLCARVEVSAGVLRIANAGLTPPLVRRHDGRFEEVSASGLLLGVSTDAQYRTETVELDRGDVVVFYTDGLTEALKGGRLFGPDGVRAVLERHAHRRASDLVDELLHAVRGWAEAPLDDLTLVVLKQITTPQPVRGRIARPALKLEPAAADTAG